MQVKIAPFCFSRTVVQLAFTVSPVSYIKKCCLLRPRVTIYAYHHVRLFPHEPVVVKQPQLNRVEGVGIAIAIKFVLGAKF